jgi:probable F420-dependent oxidoreductase
MEFGFTVPTRGPLATRESISAVVAKGEALGFTYATVNDHIVVPRSVASPYPYSDSGAWAGGRLGEALEQLSLLSFLAGITWELRLLTAVMVVPYRNPVLTARILATVDVLSQGRVTVGCGVGWMREEFEALGAPPFVARGSVVDEYLAVFKEVWTSDAPDYDGAYSRFSDISALPRPVQEPHPPLWIGGESAPALRRAARLGDGWFPIGNNPRAPLDTPERYRAAVDWLQGLAEQYGRDPAALDLAYGANWLYGEGAKQTADGARKAFTGGSADIVDDIGQFGEIGLRHLLLSFQCKTLDETLERMEQFKREVADVAGGS